MDDIAETANRWRSDPHTLASDFRKFVLDVERFTDKDHELHHDDPDARRLWRIGEKDAAIELGKVRLFGEKLECFRVITNDTLISSDLLDELIAGLNKLITSGKYSKLPSIKQIRRTATNLEARANADVVRGEANPKSEAIEKTSSVEEELAPATDQVPEGIHAPTHTKDSNGIETEEKGATSEVGDAQNSNATGPAGTSGEIFSELLRPIQQKLAAIERKQRKDEPLTEKEIIRQQMIGFSCPRRGKEPQETWPKIWEDYCAKYPKEKRGERDSYNTIRHAHNRNCPTCKKSKQ